MNILQAQNQNQKQEGIMVVMHEDTDKIQEIKKELTPFLHT
jgi:hypothetical protein